MGVVSAVQVVVPGAPVTLSAASSAGEGPLSFAWTQTRGASVSLSDNHSPSAFQTSFTAPASPQVLDFTLVVTDAQNRVSAPAFTSVIVGGPPTARFVPDAGVFAGGSLVNLTSTSFDDAGLRLTLHQWQLLSGSQGSLLSDGGATAVLSLPNPAVNEGDVLVSVQLQVTNENGVTSAPTQRSYVAQHASGENWFLSASAPSQLTFTGAGGFVNLTADGGAGVALSYGWTCNGGVAVVGADTQSASYAIPVVQGAPRLITCTVTASGQPPLFPLTRTATVGTVIRDGKAPSIVDEGVAGGREGIFGHVVVFDEPIAEPPLTPEPSYAYCTSASSTYNRSDWVNDSAIITFNADTLGRTCNLRGWTATDPAGNSVAVPANPALVTALWEGPWSSTTTFSDPRPVLAALSQLPRAQYRALGPDPAPVPPWALVATEGSTLLEFAFDPLSADAGCGAACVMASTGHAVPELAGSVAPLGRQRAFFDGRSLFVAFEYADGGTLTVERDSSGAWASNPAFTGTPAIVQHGLGQARVVGGNQLVIERYDRQSRSMVGLENIGAASAPITRFDVLDWLNLNHDVGGHALIQRSTGTEHLSRSGTSAWSLAAINSFPPDLSRFRLALTENAWVGERPSTSGQYLGAFGYGSSTANFRPAPAASPMGWDLAVRGVFVWIVWSELGDVKLGRFLSSGLSGAIIPGPPRGALSPPPDALDVDPACEAAYPTLSFIESALVVTWQERCSSGGPWTVNARILR